MALRLIAVTVIVTCVGLKLSVKGFARDEPNCIGTQSYCPSSVQQRVDRSFSAIEIDRPVATFDGHRTVIDPAMAAIHGLTEVAGTGCDTDGECELRDANGIRYTLWGEPKNLVVVAKQLVVDDFGQQPILALGIGTARKRGQVVSNVRRFVGDIPVRCISQAASDDAWLTVCSVFLQPGWVQIGFDDQDTLIDVQFIGYDFAG